MFLSFGEVFKETIENGKRAFKNIGNILIFSFFGREVRKRLGKDLLSLIG